MRYFRKIVSATGVLGDWNDSCPLVLYIAYLVQLIEKHTALDKAVHKKGSYDCNDYSLSEYSPKMRDMQAKLIILAQKAKVLTMNNKLPIWKNRILNKLLRFGELSAV